MKRFRATFTSVVEVEFDAPNLEAAQEIAIDYNTYHEDWEENAVLEGVELHEDDE